MKTRTEKILTVMNVLCWIVFVGLMIQAGALMVSYVMSSLNPQSGRSFYPGVNLLPLMEISFRDYTIAIAFMVALSMLKAYVAFLIIKVLSKIKMASPFTVEISMLLEKVSYFIIALWGVAVLSHGYSTWLLKKIEGHPSNNWASGELIVLAGVVFVMSQIFKKGVEIQSENELTV